MNLKVSLRGLFTPGGQNPDFCPCLWSKLNPRTKIQTADYYLKQGKNPQFKSWYIYIYIWCKHALNVPIYLKDLVFFIFYLKKTMMRVFRNWCKVNGLHCRLIKCQTRELLWTEKFHIIFICFVRVWYRVFRFYSTLNELYAWRGQIEKKIENWNGNSWRKCRKKYFSNWNFFIIFKG